MTKKEGINPKMLMSKEELGIPDYYVGKVFGYEARRVVEDFDLSYNMATAVSYLLRAKRNIVMVAYKIYRKQLITYTLN